jgi:C4-type Zn-finger protein
MKVIKYGNKIKHIECPYCGSLLEYDYTDRIAKLLRNGHLIYKTIECPVCHTEIEEK